jgi:FMN reductase
VDHAVRPLFAYLNAAVVATGVYAATEDWGRTGDAVDGSLVERIDRAARELSASIVARESPAPADPFADPVPFDQHLRSG